VIREVRENARTPAGYLRVRVLGGVHLMRCTAGRSVLAQVNRAEVPEISGHGFNVQGWFVVNGLRGMAVSHTLWGGGDCPLWPIRRSRLAS
jgi:hypothetical protein